MICLGIESTAHTFGVGIVDGNCNVLANEKAAFSTEEGGIKPSEAADFHYRNGHRVIKEALAKAGLGMEEIGLVSFSQGPGLGPCLKFGAAAARFLALSYGKPLLGVNHCVAHIEIGKKKCSAKDPLVVYASGANTQIIGYESGRYRVYGETLDTGVGNLLDTFGRYMGIGFPAGPKIDRMYFEAKNYIELPYTVKGMDLIFSGLLTAARAKIGKAEKKDLAYSLMHNAFAMLTEVSERALAHTRKKELLVTGGVAASKALQQMLGKMCEERGCEFKVTPFDVACDNGAMIAWQGIVEHRAGRRMKPEDTAINQKSRTDQIEVIWA
jgi:N6-L-threonylcarbamoyladenine synthase